VALWAFVRLVFTDFEADNTLRFCFRALYLQNLPEFEGEGVNILCEIFVTIHLNVLEMYTVLYGRKAFVEQRETKRGALLF
jgi:hypothetical protein